MKSESLKYRTSAVRYVEFHAKVGKAHSTHAPASRR
jgi:hypothetical protein